MVTVLLYLHRCLRPLDSYDAGYRRQVTITGNRHWSRCNATLYTYYASRGMLGQLGDARYVSVHPTTKNCTLQGNMESELPSRVKAVESALLAFSSRHTARPTPPSGLVCHLWNRGACTYVRCWHAHVCRGLGGLTW